MITADAPRRLAVAMTAVIVGAACRTAAPPPLPCPPCAPEVRVVEVTVPVPVPCHVTIVPPPAERLPGVAPGDTRAILEALVADLLAWRRAYTAQRIAVEACADAPGGPRIDDRPSGGTTTPPR